MSFFISDEKSFLEVVYTGEVDDDIVMACLDETYRTEGFASKNQLVDYTDVTNYKVTIPGLKRVSERVNARIAADGPVIGRRIAYVVPEDIEYGMGRVFLAYIKETERNQLFRNRAQAIAWLGAKDNESDLPSAC